MGSKTLYLEEIGEIELKKSKRARKINIALEPFKGVRVSIPYFCSYQEAKKAILEKLDWIRKNKKLIEEKESKLTIFDEETVFSTRRHELSIQRTIRPKPYSRISGEKLIIYIPIRLDIYSQEIQNFIRAALEEVYRLEAKEYLPGRICELSLRYQLAFNRVFIRKTRSTWGSCSPEDNINLSIHLMRLPEELIDYVILHELSHTLEKNHSRKFWRVLDSVTGNRAKELDKELSNHHLTIY